MCWSKVCARLAICLFHIHVLRRGWKDWKDWKDWRDWRWCRKREKYKDKVSTKQSKFGSGSETSLQPVPPHVPSWAVPRERLSKDGPRRRTKRKNGCRYEKSDTRPPKGSDVDDADRDTSSASSCDEAVDNRMRCIVKGVNGGPDRVVWINAGPGGSLGV